MPISEVFNIDCLKYMKNVPDKYFELAIVDPPYGINSPNMNMGGNRGYISTAERLRKRMLRNYSNEKRSINTAKTILKCHKKLKKNFRLGNWQDDSRR